MKFAWKQRTLVFSCLDNPVESMDVYIRLLHWLTRNSKISNLFMKSLTTLEYWPNPQKCFTISIQFQFQFLFGTGLMNCLKNYVGCSRGSNSLVLMVRVLMSKRYNIGCELDLSLLNNLYRCRKMASQTQEIQPHYEYIHFCSSQAPILTNPIGLLGLFWPENDKRGGLCLNWMKLPMNGISLSQFANKAETKDHDEAIADQRDALIKREEQISAEINSIKDEGKVQSSLKF